MQNDDPKQPRPARRVRELAVALDVHPVSIYRAIAIGQIKATRIGGILRIPDPEYRRLTGEVA